MIVSMRIFNDKPAKKGYICNTVRPVDPMCVGETKNFQRKEKTISVDANT